MTDAPVPPSADDTDWTWVLDEACPECGFDATGVHREELPEQIRKCARRFIDFLDAPDAAERPSSQIWSTLEYGCHVRDVCLRFADRAQLMLTDDDPVFANWDQDETAVLERYWEQEPRVVAEQLRQSAETAAQIFGGVRADQWHRTGRRSNGSEFTIGSLGRYFLHDLVHHVHDVGRHAETRGHHA